MTTTPAPIVHRAGAVPPRPLRAGDVVTFGDYRNPADPTSDYLEAGRLTVAYVGRNPSDTAPSSVLKMDDRRLMFRAPLEGDHSRTITAVTA